MSDLSGETSDAQSTVVTREDLVKAIDYEIVAMTDERRLDGITLWAALLALTPILVLVGGEWQSVRHDWAKVGILFIAVTLVGEAISTAIEMESVEHPTVAPRRLPLGLARRPIAVALIQRTLLGILLVRTAGAQPTFLIIAAIGVLCWPYLIFISMYISTAVMTKLPITSEAQRAVAASLKNPHFKLTYLEPLVVLVVGLAIELSAQRSQPSTTLLTIKLALLCYAGQCLAIIILSQGPNRVTVQLFKLRRMVLTGAASTAVANIALRSAVSPIIETLSAFNTYGQAIESMAALREAVDVAARAKKLASDVALAERIKAVGDEGRTVCATATLQMAALRIIDPFWAVALSPITSRLERELAEFERVMAFSVAIRSSLDVSEVTSRMPPNSP